MIWINVMLSKSSSAVESRKYRRVLKHGWFPRPVLPAYDIRLAFAFRVEPVLGIHKTRIRHSSMTFSVSNEKQTRATELVG